MLWNFSLHVNRYKSAVKRLKCSHQVLLPWSLITTQTLKSSISGGVHLPRARKATLAAAQASKVPGGEKHSKCSFPTLRPLCSQPPHFPCLLKQLHLFAPLDLPWDQTTHQFHVHWVPTALRKWSKPLTKALEPALAPPPSPSSQPPKPLHAPVPGPPRLPLHPVNCACSHSLHRAFPLSTWLIPSFRSQIKCHFSRDVSSYVTSCHVGPAH